MELLPCPVVPVVTTPRPSRPRAPSPPSPAVCGGGAAGRPAGGCPGPARQDWRVDPGERFFRTRAHQGRVVERQAMIDRTHALPITKQAAAMGVSRGSGYYKPRPVSEADLALMRRLDALHLEFPYAG